MATKTFKIGEYCTGGIITVTITGKVIQIFIKEWDCSTGYNRGSSQKGAKVISSASCLATERDAEWKLERYLNTVTTSYYSSVVIDWIKTKVKLQYAPDWAAW